MVTELLPAEQGAAGWVLRPTRSMTWPEAKRFILAVTAVSLAIGGFFLYRGFPLVLPFSGLEAAAVAFALYLVLRDGERREVVRIAGDRVLIETGTREIENRFEFNRPWVHVELRQSRFRYHPSRLVVAYRGETLELGRFLTEAERERFARTLINALGKNR